VSPKLERTLLAVACFVTAAPARAVPPAQKGEERSLRSSIGVGAAKPLLRADAREVRERAFARLGGAGTARALELLARALDVGGAARDARERLSVVRALAPHAADPTAQDALIRALGGLEGRSSERDRLVEQTAALALGASRHPLALSALARALRQPGRASEAARIALTAHPPTRIEPLLLAAGAPTTALLELLGELGKPTARPLVERLAKQSAPSLQAAALNALFKLDRERAVELSRTTFSVVADSHVRATCGRVLALAGTEDAGGALLTLVNDPATRGEALAIALEAPSPALGDALATARPTDSDADQLFAALGRAGGTRALARLERELANAGNTWSVAYALALSPDADADTVLERALGRPAQRRDAARGAALRFVASGRRVAGLDRALEALARGDAADRGASAWCRAVLEPARAAASLTSGDPNLVRAVARQAFTPELASVAAQRLRTERDASLTCALATSLAEPDAQNLVPTATLVTLLERGGAETYLAAYALARRDDEALRPRLLELLEAEDPSLRVHAALGLGASTQASAVGVLARAYRSEVEPRVRRALVTALASRPEHAVSVVLGLAATLDPDAEARAAARRALERRAPSAPPEPGPPPHADTGTAWIRVLSPASGGAGLLLITTPLGLSLPLSTDADGSVTVGALGEGDIGVTLVTPAPSTSLPAQPAAASPSGGTKP
jgi:hypothetical protein